MSDVKDLSAPTILPSPAGADTNAPTVAPQAPPSPPTARMLRRSHAAIAAPPASSQPEAKKLGNEERASRVITRLRNEVAEGKGARDERDALRKELTEYAKAQLDAAPEPVRKFIERRAKDDPRAALELLRELRADGLIPSASPGAPAHTAPRVKTEGAPAPAGSATGDDAVLAEFNRLNERSPRVAQAYGLQNRDALNRAKARAKSTTAN